MHVKQISIGSSVLVNRIISLSLSTSLQLQARQGHIHHESIDALSPDGAAAAATAW